MHLQKYKDDFILLLEAGFIAVNQMDEDSALKLFKAAELLNPANTLPKVGFGYLHLHKLELNQAVKYFEEVLHAEPQNEMAKALLGLSMSLMPTQLSNGEKVLQETLKSQDPMIKNLAHEAVAFVDKFVKPKQGSAGKKAP